jgi:restriction system protein
LEEDVAEELHLSEQVRTIPHGDGRRTQFQYDLAWVRTYLKWGGVVENSERGVWHLTAAGRGIPNNELRTLWNRIVADQRKHRKQKVRIPKTDEGETRADEASDIQENHWKERLLDVVLGMDAKGFERLSQRLLRESGFIKVEVTGRSGDGGIDGVGVLRVNLLSFHVLFQCKKWKNPVGAPTIRDFRGAMVGRADKGLIITTSSFTADARREATRDGAPAIDLVDGDALCELLKSAKIGVRVQLIEQVTVDASVFAEFAVA